MSSPQSQLRICASDDSFGPVVHGCRDNFDFTLQFESLILSIVPASLFIVASVPRIARLSRVRQVVGGVYLQWAKVGLIATYLSLQIALLVLSVKSHIHSHNAAIGAATLAILVALVSLGLSWMEHAKSLRPSILFSIYLFLTILFDITQARTLLSISTSWTLGRLFTAATCLKGAILLLENYPKSQWALFEQSSSEPGIGIFSIAMYTWLNPLILLGSSKILGVNDLYNLDPAMTSARLDTRFWSAWNSPPSWSSKPRLFLVLAKIMKFQLLVPVIPRLAKIGFDFCQPFLIQSIQKHLSKSEGPELARESKALIGATVLIYLGMAASLGIHQYYHQRANTFLRGYLVAGIFRKATMAGLPPSASQTAVTLMSTDVERIQQGFRSIHEIWANTVEVGLAAWLLYQQLGLASLVPVGVVIACFLGTMVVSRTTPQLLKLWVTATEERVSATANIINNIKSLKIMGLTDHVGRLIQSMRELEIKAGSAFRNMSVWAFMFAFAPMMISPFLTFAATSQQVDTTRAFASWSLLRLLTIPLANLFQITPALLAAITCFRRIDDYLGTELKSDYRTILPRDSMTEKSSPAPVLKDEKCSIGSENLVASTTTMQPAFLFKGGCFGWEEGRYALQILDCAIPASKLTMVVGPVGSGKSTLCRTILGEVPFATGHLLCQSSITTIGFCDQRPFIPNGSLRSVILGYGRFEEQWYNRVVEAAELWPDIALFPNGDQTLVGPNGSNLSGGQQQRLAIARALYARPSTFIFDDIFSGLDNRTEGIIFEKVFGARGIIKHLDATAILCTHAVSRLRSADYIIALGKDGGILEQGTYEQLKVNKSYVESLNIQDSEKFNGDSDSVVNSTYLESSEIPLITEADLDDRNRQLGDLSVYKQYLSTLGPIQLMLFALLSLSAAFCDNFATIWLKFWSDYTTQNPGITKRQGFYIGILAVIQTSGFLCLIVATVITSIFMVRNSGRIFHLRAIRTLVGAPLSLFYKTPPGTLLNRFSQDLNIIDTELEEHFFDFVFCIEVAIGMAAVIATASPYVAISYPIFGVILYMLQNFYLRTSRQLRFLDLEMKSPLFTHFLETLSGLSTVRAFGWINAVIDINYKLIDTSQRPSYLLSVVQIWLMIALALIVAVLAIFVVSLATQLRSNAGLAGASLVSLMSFGNILTNIVKTWTMLELGIGAVSRIESFCKTVKTEAGADGAEPLPDNWPQSGAIEIRNISASYAATDDDHQHEEITRSDNEQLALRDISLIINPGEKVAITGRTGSGKSSILLLILRLLHPLPSRNSVITIDGIALRNIDPNILRSRIIALSQDPVLLPVGNSYRANLDPHEIALPEDCKAALGEVGMWSLVEDRGGLDEPLKAESLSKGQMQLFNIARAVLRARINANISASQTVGSEKTGLKQGGILLLDEITSSADSEMDAHIQRIIREVFGTYTIISITHREDNVADFDRMITMKAGSIVGDQDLKKLMRSST